MTNVQFHIVSHKNLAICTCLVRSSVEKCEILYVVLSEFTTQIKQTINQLNQC